MAGFFSLTAIADEGMWLPQLLQAMNEEDMQAHGLQLTAEDLYSVNNSSLKDAIVSLGGFCTGEMISLEGKTNFFEKRVMDYSKANVGLTNNANNRTLVLDADF